MKSEYIPVQEFFVLYKKNRKHPYHTWVESYEDAMKEVKWLRKTYKDKHEQIVFCKPWNVFYGKKGEKTWFLFDLGNGHPPVPRYLWEFKTREEARIHSKKQKKMKFGSPLSKPVKFEKVGWYHIKNK